MKYNNISELRKILIEELTDYDGEKTILLPFSNKLLRKIFFNEHEFAPEVKSIIYKIDFSNISFKGFNAYGYDFSKLHGVKINPQKILEKDLTNSDCEGVTFIGPFDGVKVRGTSFKGSKGAKIDPQIVYNKDFSYSDCYDVEFIGSFDGVILHEANLKGSNYKKIVNYEKKFRQKIKTLVKENNVKKK